MKRLMIAVAILIGSWHAPPVLAADAVKGNSRLQAKRYGGAERGQEIVAMWCVGCHSVGATADDRIPSLMSLAANPKNTNDAIRNFLMRPHTPMPPLELSTQQIDDIIAYLWTLPPAPAPSR
jgi:mono/diheme cytochrome c family protein